MGLGHSSYILIPPTPTVQSRLSKGFEMMSVETPTADSIVSNEIQLGSRH